MSWLWCRKNVKLRDGVYAIETSSLRLVWMKHESYILQSSAAMYTFQNLNTGINDKVWPDLDQGKRSNWGRGMYYWKVLPEGRCRPNIKAASSNTSAVTNTFQNLNAKLKHGFKWQSITWPWPWQKVKLREKSVLLKGLTLMSVWAKY